MPDFPESHLQIIRVSKRYGLRRLFSNLSCDVRPGIILGITGPNGSGKSTLLKIMAGVVTPDSGEVRLVLDGEHIAPHERPLRCGMVAPYLNVYDGLTARENLAFIAKLRGLPRSGDALNEHLDFVGLAGRGDDLVRTYSTGLKQRMRFAAALLSRPPVLLLDEPASNLDAAGMSVLDRVIDRQRSQWKLIVLATNDPREAARCDVTVELGNAER